MANSKKFRKLIGLTQLELARLARIDRSRLSLAETGQVQLRPDEQKALQRVLVGAFQRRVDELQRAMGELVS